MMRDGVVIPGVPVQQGSKTGHIVHPKGGGRPIVNMVETNHDRLQDWRKRADRAIKTARPFLALDAPVFGKHQPVALSVRFVFGLRGADNDAIRRVEKSGGETHPCQPGCTHLPWHTTTPDKDKCLRALFDVLTKAHVWHDDGQCARFDVLAYRGPAPMTMVRWAAM